MTPLLCTFLSSYFAVAKVGMTQIICVSSAHSCFTQDPHACGEILCGTVSALRMVIVWLGRAQQA